MQLYRLLVYAQLLAVALTGVTCAASASMEHPPIATAPDVIRVLQRRANVLQTGIFRARGRLVEDLAGSRPNESYETVTEIYAAFDRPARLLRFDRERSFWLPEGPYHATFQFVSTPDRVFRRGRLSDRIVVDPPGTPPDRRSGVFDVRSLGIASFGELVGRIELDGMFQSGGILSAENVVDFREDGEGIIRVMWQFGPAREARRTIWLDRQKEFAPIRMEERYIMIGGDPPAPIPHDWSEPGHTAKVTWTRASSQVWVPKTALIEHRAGVFLADHPTKTTKIWELEFDWECVNCPVDPAVFTVEGMDRTSGTSIVVDRTLGGRPIITQYPGKDAAEVRMLEGARSKLPDEYGTSASHHTVLWWGVLVLNLALASLIVAGLYLWKRAK